MKSGEQGTTANQNPVGVQCENQDVSRQSIRFDGNLAQDVRATPLLKLRGAAILRRCQGYAPVERADFAAKALKGRHILAMGEAHRNGNANPSQALKGRNDQAMGKGRGAGIWPFLPMRTISPHRGSYLRLCSASHYTLSGLGGSQKERPLPGGPGAACAAWRGRA